MADRIFHVKEELKKLPESPGVYLMHNCVDEIIYVGKAVNLKNRVSQYFHHHQDRSKKIEQMIASIAWFEYIQVESELEALVLESNLIKAYRPRYNSVLRDDENHPYFKITMQEAFPKITVCTENERDGSVYLGPYYKSMMPENILDFVNKYFRLRTCNKKFDAQKSDTTPCLQYHLGLCSGPCTGKISEEAYRNQVNQAICFIRGERDPVKAALNEQMMKAVDTLDFERAGSCKKLLADVHMIEDKLDFSKRDGKDHADLIAFAEENGKAAIAVYLIRSRKMIGRDLFYDTVDPGMAAGVYLKQFMLDFYAGAPYIPSKIYLSDPLRDKQAVESALTDLRGSAVHCTVPRTGEYGRLVKISKQNAGLLLAQRYGRNNA